MSQIKTDNSYFESKVKLRIDHLPNEINIDVLDVFTGHQLIWDEIKSRIPKKKINVLGIDKRQFNKIILKGDNRKYLKKINLDRFNVIDLDAYGIPFSQLDILFNRNIKNKTIYVTFIQSTFGQLPKKMLNYIGIPNRFINKIPTLFNKNGLEKFKKYLAFNNVSMIYYYSYNNKHYIAFKI